MTQVAKKIVLAQLGAAWEVTLGTWLVRQDEVFVWLRHGDPFFQSPVKPASKTPPRHMPLVKANMRLRQIPILAPSERVRQRLAACRECENSTFDAVGALIGCKACGCGSNIAIEAQRESRVGYNNLDGRLSPCRKGLWEPLKF